MPNDKKDGQTSVQELFEKLEKHFTDQFKEIKEGRKLTDTEIEAAQKNLDEKLTDIKASLEEQRLKMEEAARTRSLPGTEEETSFSFHKAYRGILTNNWDEAGLEKEVFNEMKTKEATAGDGSQGGYLVPTEMANWITEPAIAAMPLRKMGIRMLTNVRGTFEIPVLETRPEGGHTSENGELQEISYTFGEKRMVPHRGGGYTKISKRLIMQTGGIAETFIRDQLVKSTALTLHKGAMAGSGNDNEPKGLLNQTGFTAFGGTSGGQLTLKELRQLRTDLQEVDFDLEMGSFAAITRAIVLEGATLHRTEQYSGQTTGKNFVIKTLDLTEKKLMELAGYPIETTTHIPITNNLAPLIYGDFSHAIMALWGGMELEVSTQASDSAGNSAFLKNQVWVKADQDYDFVVDFPAAFIKADFAANRSSFTEY